MVEHPFFFVGIMVLFKFSSIFLLLFVSKERSCSGRLFRQILKFARNEVQSISLVRIVSLFL